MNSKMQTLFLTGLLAAFAAFTAFASAQVVDTDPRMVTVVENQENVNLHCRIGRPTGLCLIQVPGYGQFSLSPNDATQHPGLKYYGEGYERGSCGVTIERVTVENAGNMTCVLLPTGGGGGTLTGSIEIVVAFPPVPPQIEVKSGNLDQVQVDSRLEFECVAARGNPAANISWFLDNEQIYQGVRPIEPEENFDEASGKRYFTAVSTLTHTVRAEDNGKRLTCQAEHLAYPDGVSRTDLVLSVNFQPQALPDQTIYGLQLGRTATASLVIKANPPPTIMWNIDGIDHHQGAENGRYAVPNPEALGNNRYNVTLTIAGLTLEDLSKTYTLRASNSFGVEEYRVMLRSQDEVINESSGVGIGEIVGLVLAVLIVLTAVALILVARATGRWCFRGASLNTDINPDSEAQITPHPHDDEIDEKLQTQDPAAHFVHEGDEKHPATNGKHENGKQTKPQPPTVPAGAAGGKQENGKTESKTNTSV